MILRPYQTKAIDAVLRGIEELLGLLREKYDEDDPCISGKCWYCRVRKALEGQ